MCTFIVLYTLYNLKPFENINKIETFKFVRFFFLKILFQTALLSHDLITYFICILFAFLIWGEGGEQSRERVKKNCGRYYFYSLYIISIHLGHHQTLHPELEYLKLL